MVESIICMRSIPNLLFFMYVSILLVSCNQPAPIEKKSEGVKPTDTIAIAKKAIRDRVITSEEQSKLTPDLVIQRLKEGNARFIASNLTARDHSSLVRDAAKGQYPEAVILSCMDSRVPVEDIFDNSIGDLFVCRVAGNVLNQDILGSLEYGCKVSGAKVIVVMGHRYCGAVKSAIKDVKMGNITPLLAKVKPAINDLKNFAGPRGYSNEDYVTQVAIQNVINVVAEIKRKSPILKSMVDSGTLKIVSAGYDLDNGGVTFFADKQ